MSRFSELMHHIFKHEPVAENPNAAGPIGGASGGGGIRPPAASPAAATATATNVDVEKILDGLASSNHEKLDWKHSIVDLMKLVGIDSGLAARKELATELHYTGDTNDSAAMNIWLHKQVMKKLAENGGKVPASLM
jgi:hypothetical protein